MYSSTWRRSVRWQTGLQSPLQFVELTITGQARILGAEALGVAECVVVDQADESVQLHQ